MPDETKIRQGLEDPATASVPPGPLKELLLALADEAGIGGDVIEYSAVGRFTPGRPAELVLTDKEVRTLGAAKGAKKLTDWIASVADDDLYDEPVEHAVVVRVETKPKVG